MPISALPERLRSIEAWENSDMDNWYQRWILKYIHGWFAYGPRATQKWARWREWPITLFKIGGEGDWRYEDDVNTRPHKLTPGYLSRIQYWKRWHFQIQWPFMVACHFYFSQKFVLSYLTHDNTDNKLFYCYFGAHRDADKVFWFPSAFIGLTWK